MYINETCRDLPLLVQTSHLYMGRDGAERTETEDLLREHSMEVYVNDRLTMRLVCVPQYLSELVLGRLLTEGIIRTAADVEQIYICEAGLRARVLLRPGLASPSAKSAPCVEDTPTCCTDNRILHRDFSQYQKLAPVKPIPWEASWIFSMADRFAKGMPLHEKTWATHSCLLACQGELLFSCEDIGRHNALDKAIGYALKNGVDPGHCILYSSGRIPVDMASKAIRAGIPVLASKAAPTAEAVELAKSCHLTLICAARRDRMKRYT